MKFIEMRDICQMPWYSKNWERIGKNLISHIELIK